MKDDDFRIYLANELSRGESLAFFSRSILQTSFPAGNPWHFFRNQFCKRAFQGGIHGFFQWQEENDAMDIYCEGDFIMKVKE